MVEHESSFRPVSLLHQLCRKGPSKFFHRNFVISHYQNIFIELHLHIMQIHATSRKDITLNGGAWSDCMNQYVFITDSSNQENRSN